MGLRIARYPGDLIIGSDLTSAVGTLIEPKARIVMLLYRPHGRTPEHVRDALTGPGTELPAALQRTLTWDQRKEIAQHMRYTVETDVLVYSCSPYSPWHRGTHKNTNGLLRQYGRRGTSFENVTGDPLHATSDCLNRRPRKTLDWRLPAEAYAQTAAMTDGDLRRH
jgi:transposase, IS30 family